MSQTYKYFAFISYSRKDSKVAAWLQSRLEWFRFPVKLVAVDRRPPHDRYVRPIYRDKTNLEVTDEHYWMNIRRALEESRYLIVLCSPSSAGSTPVDMEVAHFLETHGGDASAVVPVIVSGNVTSMGDDAALSPALRALGHALIDRNLPTMVPDTTIAEQDAWEQGFVSLVSYLLRLERSALGDHIQRETKRQARVLRRWLVAVVLLTLCAIAAGIYSIIQQREAERQSKEAALQKREVQNQKNQQDAMLLSASYADHEQAIKAIDENRVGAGIAHFERSLRHATKNTGALAAAAQYATGINDTSLRPWSTLKFDSAPTSWSFSPDGRHLGMTCRDNSVRVIVTATGEEILRANSRTRVDGVNFSFDGRYVVVNDGYYVRQMIEVATGKEISKHVFGDTDGSVSFSLDGRKIAVGSYENKTARVFDAATHQELSKADFEEGVKSVNFSPDGRYLMARISDRSLRVLNATTCKELSRTEFKVETSSVRFHPNGHLFAAGVSDNSVVMIETLTGKEIWKTVFEKNDFSGNVASLRFCNDGHRLFAFVSDNSYRILEAETGKVISKSKPNLLNEETEFSPDGLHLAAGGYTVQMIEAATGNEEWKVSFAGEVKSVSFSPDGRYLATGSTNNIARVLDAKTGKEISKYEFGREVGSVCFSPDGSYLLAYLRDNTFRVLETATSKVVCKIMCEDDVKTLSYSHDGRHMASGGKDGTVRVIEAASGKVVCQTVFGGSVESVSFSPDGRYFAAGSQDKDVRVIETGSGKEVCKFLFDSWVSSVVFSPDGRHFAAGSGDNTARVIEVETGKVRSTTLFGGFVNDVVFSPDGSCIAAGATDNTARVIEVATGNELYRTVFDSAVISIVFSPDGHQIAAGTKNGTVRVIKAATGKEVYNHAFGNAVGNVVFSPDGRCIAMGVADNTARVIEVTSGREINKHVFGSWVSSLTYSPDGRFLAAGSDDMTARVFRADTGKEVYRTLLDSRVNVLRFSPDGRHLAMGSYFAVRVFESIWQATDPEVTTPFMKAMTLLSGFQYEPDGHLAPVIASDFTQAQREVAAFVKAPPPPEANWQHAILTWLAMTPETRTTSPWSNEPLCLAAGRWFMQSSGKGGSAFIIDTANEAPWHPLEPLSMARLEPKPDEKTDTDARNKSLIRPRLLARLTLQRLRQANEPLYGRDTLAEYAAWAAKIMHEELHLDSEAQEAIAFARTHTPPERQKDLLQLKEKLEGK